MFQCSIANSKDNLIMHSVRLKFHKDIEIITQTIATALIIYLLFNKKNGLFDSMNNKFFKYTVFLAVGIALSTTLFLSEFDKNNSNILLAQEQEKSIDQINNKNIQPSSIFNSNTGNFKKLIMTEISDTRTTSNYNEDYAYELIINIPKGSFHPATHRSFNPDEIIINKGQTITWINEDKAPHTITSKGKLLFDSLLKQDEDFTFKFDKVGTFEFGCTLHPWMHETINVI